MKEGATAGSPKLSISVLAGSALCFMAMASAQVPVPDPEAMPRPAASELVSWDNPVVKIERAKCHASNGSRTALAVWRLTVENTSGRPVGNIVVETFYFARSGSVLRSGGGRIMKIIPPHSKRSFDVADGRLPAHTDGVAVNALMVDFMDVR
jgi:hypothetical protein